MIKPIQDRLAVCSWSLQPASPAQLIEHLRTIGLSRVQLALDPLREQPAVWGGTAAMFREHGITIVSGMFGTVGEDYTSLETIRRTGGLVPDETWEQNWANAQANATLAQQLGLNLVTFHAGFLPHEESDPEFAKLLQRIRLVAEVFAAKGIDLAFETGQETADSLRLLVGFCACSRPKRSGSAVFRSRFPFLPAPIGGAGSSGMVALPFSGSSGSSGTVRAAIASPPDSSARRMPAGR